MVSNNNRRESDRENFQMLVSQGKDIEYIKINIEAINEHFKLCKIAEIRSEQDKIRAKLKWISRVGSVVRFRLGSAIFVVLLFHSNTLKKGV